MSEDSEEKIAIWLFVGVLVLIGGCNAWRFKRCRGDGYNTTQCMALISSDRPIVGLGQPER